MCKHLITNANGTGQCGLALQQGCPPQLKSRIRQAFQEAAAKKYLDPKPKLGIAGGPPNCMFYNNPYLTWTDCPEYQP